MPYANDFFSPRGAKPGGKGGGRGGRIKSLVTDLQEVGRSTAMDHSSHDPPSILPRVFLVSPARLNNFQSRNRVGYIRTALGEESNRPNIESNFRIHELNARCQCAIFHALNENKKITLPFLLFQKPFSRPLPRNGFS